MFTLITGGAGFIGSHLIKKLLNEGKHIICVDNLDPYYNLFIQNGYVLKEQNVAELKRSPNFHFFNLNINEYDELKTLFDNFKISHIIHLANMAGVRYSIKNPYKYYQTNIIGTQNILELAKKNHIDHVIYASSSSVYGNNEKVPFSEDDNVDFPISPYAASKKSCELLCHAYHHLYKLNIYCLRFFTVYGPSGRPDMAPFKFTKFVTDDIPIPMFGDGSSQRDYTYIDDIVSGVVKSIDLITKKGGFEVFNLGNSNTVSLKRFIDVIQELCNKKAIINQLPMQPGDVKKTFANIEKSRQLLDYNPKTTIEEGMEKTVKWFHDNPYLSKLNYYT